MADHYLLIGSPAGVVDRLTEFAEAGVETVLIQVAAQNRAHRERIVTTVAQHVLPNVKAL